jgi:uncharacterized membrane protein
LTETINRQPTVLVARRPIHSLLVPFPVVCFIAALLTDIAYAATAEMMWADFSAWLITAGVILGVLAAIAALIDFATNRLVGEQRLAWPYVLGSLIVLVLSFFNALMHTRDAWTSVMPSGLMLSAVVVLVILMTTWLGRVMVYRRDMGILK